MASVVATPSRASLLQPEPPCAQGAPSPPTLTRGQRFLGLNGARLLASMHIVAGHLHQMNALPGGAMLFAWGFTWVPWFFMLCARRLHLAAFVRVPQPRTALASRGCLCARRGWLLAVPHSRRAPLPLGAPWWHVLSP